MNTTLASPVFENETYCRFGREALRKNLEAFQEGIDGVIADKDVEYVHRTRVASRRLRAALPLFQFCFPQKVYRKSLKEIKKATRLLGEARDLDVQICFLEEYLKNLEPIQKACIDLLQGNLVNHRNKLQKIIVPELKKMKESPGLLSLHSICEQSSDGKNTVADKLRIVEKAYWYISFRLDDFLSLEDYVGLEDEEAKHHQMRIYAKKLRYTMETFAPLYRDKLVNEIQTIRAIQDVLGELHDLDVWMMNIPRLNEAHKADNARFTQVMAQFSVYVKTKRKETYTQFVDIWAKNKKAGFFENLTRTTNPQPKSNENENKTLTPEKHYKAMTKASRTFSKRQWPDYKHFTQVTKLALTLFDSLAEVHKLGALERCWLECASILHDVGLSKGCDGHHKMSADIILNDTELPFTAEERWMIAAIARYHRKGLPKEKHYHIAPLDPINVHKVNVMAGLLRLADSLDCTHNGAVKGLTVKVRSKRIMVHYHSNTESPLVEQTFRKKKDLFETVFNKRLMLLWKPT
jgi:CHAD domain-containing protein